jgi:hypothetical protein
MKKRPVIGLTVSILVISVLIGIASLPDEVLIDSSEIESTTTSQADVPPVTTLAESQEFIANAVAEKNMDAAKAEINALKQEMLKLQNELVELKIDSQVQEEPSKDTGEKELPPKNDTQGESGGKVIKVNVKDGVGAKNR